MSRTKLSPKLMNAAKRLRKDGFSFERIAEELSKQGVPVSKASVVKWLRDPDTAPRTSTAPQASAPVSVVAPPPPPAAPSATPPPSAGAEPGAAMSRDELIVCMSDAIRAAQDAADKARDAFDAPGEARAMRLLTQLAAPLNRALAQTVDEGDVVRVRPGDVQAAADRALKGLATMAENVIAEVRAWPCCATCGRHVGEFVAGDKSPLQLMFERVARGT